MYGKAIDFLTIKINVGSLVRLVSLPLKRMPERNNVLAAVVPVDNNVGEIIITLALKLAKRKHITAIGTLIRL